MKSPKHSVSYLSALIGVSVVAFLAACPGKESGLTSGRIIVDGQKRTFELHLPENYTPEQDWPLLIAFHPFSGTGKSMASLTGFNVISDREGFIVCYPNGRQRVWNANPANPSSIIGPPADDVAFIDALLDELIDRYAIDPSRVYVTGASAGGLMAHRIACDLTDRIAAASSVMITLPAGWEETCMPAGPLPFLMVQGVDDPFFPWEGGTVNEGPFRETDYKSAAETVAFWVNNNAATSPPTIDQLPDIDPEDGTTVFRESYEAGLGGGPVIFFGIEGGGHTWPGSDKSFIQSLVGVGPISREIDASEIIWEFLKGY